jgi:hypothetical protein
MPNLFGRASTSDVASYFEKLLGSSDDERAVSYTWQNDGNVSPEREAALLEDIKASGGLIPEGCAAHIRSRVKVADYENPGLNGTNFLGPLPLDQHLVTVLWITSPGYLRSVRAGGFLPAQGIDDRDIGTWRGLVREAMMGEAGDQRAFLTELLSAANADPSRRDRPTWSTFWRVAEPILSSPTWTDGVRDALGLHHIRRGEALVVLKFEVASVPRLVRPSCLDQHWYPWFFCSPSATMDSGFAMSLSSATALIPEVIHRRPEFDATMWSGHWGETSVDPSDDLKRLRHAHYLALKRVYGAQLKWGSP